MPTYNTIFKKTLSRNISIINTRSGTVYFLDCTFEIKTKNRPGQRSQDETSSRPNDIPNSPNTARCIGDAGGKVL